MNNPYSPPGAPASLYAYAAAPSTAGAVTEGAILALAQTRPWVRVISVFSLVFAVLFVGFALIMFVAGAFAPSGGAQPFPVWALGLVYLPLAAIYVYPGIKLWMYASAIARVEASRAPADLEAALLQQKSFWKYSGIAAITMVVLYAVGFGVAILVGIAGAIGKS